MESRLKSIDVLVEHCQDINALSARFKDEDLEAAAMLLQGVLRLIDVVVLLELVKFNIIG